MFPNPQSSLPLPRHPDLEQYKKLAKELLRAAKSTDPDAIRNWSTNWVRGLVERSGIKITPRNFRCGPMAGSALASVHGITS
jgi:hypothetical protein